MNKQKHIASLLPLIISLVVLFVVVLLLPLQIILGSHADEAVVPKNILISDISPNSFTVTFNTDKKSVGTVSFGQKGKLDQVALDSLGAVAVYTHQVSAQNLRPGTAYSFVIRTDTTISNDKGQPFSVTTPSSSNTPPPPPRIVTGVLPVIKDDKDSADNVVILQAQGRNLSTRADAAGKWLFTWTNLVDTQGKYESFNENTPVKAIVYQGSNPAYTFPVDLKKGKAAPAPTQVKLEQPLGQTAQAVNKTWWDSVLEFFANLFGQNKSK